MGRFEKISVKKAAIGGHYHFRFIRGVANGT